MTSRRRAVDQRGRLAAEPFGYTTTKDGQIRITYDGRVVTTVAGEQGLRLGRRLEQAEAGGQPTQVQLLLAKATGNFKHGNER